MIGTRADSSLAQSSAFGFKTALQFMRKNAVGALLLSVLVLIPCFWHTHIQAGDLGSHVYNAWLSQLAERGQVPGVYVVHQWNNVLFDVMVSGAARILGWHAAEFFSVSAAVLVFFWGVFSFLAVVTKKLPW